MNKRQLWKKIKKRGPILWDNTDDIMRYAGPLYAADENGELTIKDVVRLGYTLDDRISEGIYFVKAIELFKNFMQNPEILENPPSEEDIKDYYNRLIKIKQSLGLNVVENKILFVNNNPKLIIANSYSKKTRKRDERIRDIEKLLLKHGIDYTIMPWN